MQTESGALSVQTTGYQFRAAQPADLDALLDLENRSFETDRLRRRQLKYWLKANHKILLVAENDVHQILAYGLVIMRRGTRLARLYSIAVDNESRGLGIGKALMLELEQRTLEFDRFFMRLEVSRNNPAAIHLYQNLGYKVFAVHPHYYPDQSDALRMEKAIKQVSAALEQPAYPWYQQTTEFTCGPAALMMAMASLDNDFQPTQAMEFDLWREATTIFMTSGHGGCHPIGLALAAQKRGFDTEVYINKALPLFLNGVRNEHKKRVLASVEQQFAEKARQAEVKIHYQDIAIEQIDAALAAGDKVLALISTYHLSEQKGPHWVTLTGSDQQCFFLHDPALDEEHERPIDCQQVPIAKADFPRLCRYGKIQLRTVVIVRRLEHL